MLISSKVLQIDFKHKKQVENQEENNRETRGKRVAMPPRQSSKDIALLKLQRNAEKIVTLQRFRGESLAWINESASSWYWLKTYHKID